MKEKPFDLDEFKQKHRDNLKSALVAFGGRGVLQMITEIEEEAARTDYAENPNALIHQYLPILQRARNEMNGLLYQRVSGGITGMAQALSSLKGPLKRKIWKPKKKSSN